MAHITNQARDKSAAYVHDVLTRGVMRAHAAELPEAQIRELARFFTGAPLHGPDRERPFAISSSCEGEKTAFDWSDRAYPQWGGEAANRRRVRSQGALDLEATRSLGVKWVVAFPEATYVRSQPTAAGGALFVGSQDGSVFALDQETGCTRWQFKADAEVRTAVAIDFDADDTTSPRAYFADRATNVYALDASTGRLLWRRPVDEHPAATVTGSVSVHDGQLFVPISSIEDAFAMDPRYPCCSHRGAVVSLDARTGELIWRRHTIEDEPREVGTNALGTKMWGPSGASVWNTPTIDPERQRLYVGAGNNHSRPAIGHSDSVVALDLRSGDLLWAYQSEIGDAWNSACMPGFSLRQSCPDPEGPDSDFGTSPMLIEIDGRALLVAGQKSGVLHALDPTDGSLVWKQRLARGGWVDGIHFGMASDADVLFVPSSDSGEYQREGRSATPGLFAVSARDGSRVWFGSQAAICEGRRDCEAAISAPPIVTPEVAFAATLEGVVLAFDRMTGEVVWRFDTAQKFKTLAGQATRGGGIAGGAGPLVANGRLFVSSGYGFYDRPGNALIAFEPE